MLKKKFIAAIGIIALSLSLISCNSNSTTTIYKDDKKILWNKFAILEDAYFDNKTITGYLYVVYDVDTKVEYYIITTGYKLGITPVYDANGEIKVYKDE